MTAETVYWMFAGFAGLFGTLFGSFMNVCIARMPEDRSVVWPGSACPVCGTPIRPYDNVPIFAWLWLGGKCRDCKTPISVLYPTIEALFGVFAVLLFRRVIPDLALLDTAHLVAWAWYLWLLFALIALTFIDLKHQIIPDPFSIYSVPVGVGGAALLQWLGYPDGLTWQQSVVGAAAGGTVLLPLLGLYYMFRREAGMGWGDPKLLALLGAYFGVYAVIGPILIVAATVGSAIGIVIALLRRRSLRIALPFGPFLAVGAIVWLFFSEHISLAWAQWITGLVT